MGSEDLQDWTRIGAVNQQAAGPRYCVALIFGPSGSSLVSSYDSPDQGFSFVHGPSVEAGTFSTWRSKVQIVEKSQKYVLLFQIRFSSAFSTIPAMQAHATLFSQIIAGLYPSEFARLAEAFPTSKPTRGLSHYDQFLALCFGQLTYRESLRDVVACLNSRKSLLYHLGFRGHISRTNLAYANKHRDWRLYQAVAELLMRRAARLYQTECLDADLPNMVFALDSSIISLALNLFPWGYYARTRKAALKLHLLLSLKGNVPAWGAITDPHVADLRMLDQVPIYPGAYYIMDRGYMDFVRLFRFHKAGAFFVVRCKEPVSFKVCHSASVDKTKGLKCDQTVRLKSNWSAKSYPEPLRKIRVYDPEHKNMIVLLTNDFSLPAEIIAELYKRRWQVELFFKWIKQHLRIRSFFGRSENAVRGQIWTAICAYLLVAILRKQNELSKSLNEILQIVSVSIFDQLPVADLLGTERQFAQSIQNERDIQKCFSFNNL